MQVADRRCAIVLERHHEHIRNIVEALAVAATEGDGAATIDLVLIHLSRFASFHFSAEEELMQAANYPGLAAHKAEHEACKCHLHGLLHAARNHEIGLADVTGYMREWLDQHQEKADDLYLSFCAQQ